MSTDTRSPVVSPAELLASLGSVVLLDVRTGPDARASFARAHLPTARFVDLETELSTKGDPAEGGRHPLPSPAHFAALLGTLGVDPTSRVVVYDLAGGANAASRLWWMLRAAGHRDVQVLDATPSAMERAGLTMTDAASPHPACAPYPFTSWQLPTVDRERVDALRRSPDHVVLDVRAPARYRGETEPIDPIAGHIPSARNLFHLSLVDDDGRFLPREQIAARYAEVVGDVDAAHLVVHCGSGVTACHALLAFEHAGLGIGALYVGSWSEWCRNEALPRAVSEAP